MAQIPKERIIIILKAINIFVKRNYYYLSLTNYYFDKTITHHIFQFCFVFE